jgi:hypothetical protein
LAAALGALLRLSPADPPSPPPVAPPSPSPIEWRPPATRPVAAPSPVGAAVDPWAVDPILDGATLATTAAGGLQADGAGEAAAAAQAATALEESGFGGALHTALGELRRIADDPVPAGVGASAPGTGTDAAPWPSPEPASASDRLGGNPAAWLASLHDWWTARWKDLLPGIVVASLVVVAFAVVLASGTKRSDPSHVDTRRPIASDPSTTIPGLFATAEPPVGPTTSVATVPKSGSSNGPVKAGSRPVVTSPAKTVKPAPTAPVRTTPPTRPTPTTAPPTTTAPTTTAPDVTTTVPSSP